MDSNLDVESRHDSYLTDIQSQIGSTDDFILGTAFASQTVSVDLDLSEFTKLGELSKKTNQIDPFAFSIDEIKKITSSESNTLNKRIAYIRDNLHRTRRKQISKTHVCDCGGNMYKSRSGTEFVCADCGSIDIIVGGNIEDIAGVSNISMSNYNTSSDSATPIKVSGPGSNQLQRKLQCKTSEYNKVQYRELLRLIENSVAKSKYNIPKNVVNDTAEMYHEIQKLHIIKRGSVFHGAMCACMGKMCDRHGVSRKRRELISIFGIQPSDLSHGEKLIEYMRSTGRLDRKWFPNEIKVESSRIKGFLISYFIDLKIPLPEDIAPASQPDDFTITLAHPNYYGFVERLIRFSIKFKIAMSSVASSKCAGALYLLATRCPELKITVQKISKVCDISISTFKRYYTVMQDLLNTNDVQKKRLRNKLRHLFHKYQIPIS